MTTTPATILLIGASRGLGLGLAEEYLARGWQVVATARDPVRATRLAALAEAHPGRLRIEALDVMAPGDAAALAERLAGTHADVLFVVAGRSGFSDAPIHQVPQDGAALEFLTNSYAPPVVAEALLPVLKSQAPIVLMTSILGSIANNAGGMELYRAQQGCAEHAGKFVRATPSGPRGAADAPRWVRTEMGGSSAPARHRHQRTRHGRRHRRPWRRPRRRVSGLHGGDYSLVISIRRLRD